MESPFNNNRNNSLTPNNNNNIRISLKPSENSNINNLNNFFNKQDYNNILDNPLVNNNNNSLKELNFNIENLSINNNNGNIKNKDNTPSKNLLNNNANLNNSGNFSVLMDDNANNFTREEVIHKCSNIFLNFSKFDKKEKQFFINTTNVKKVFKTVNLIDEKSLKSSDIDILIKKINPNVTKFNERNFLDLIVMITARIYPKDYAKNPKNTVDNLISTFFEPFSKHIEDKDVNLTEALKMPYVHRSLDLLITKFVIDYKLVALLNNVLFAIKEIYKNYFNMESMSSKNYAKITEISQANLIQFCKDFEIVPFMMNQEQLVIYFDLIIKKEIINLTNSHQNLNSNENYENYIIEPKKDLGTVFTLSRFCTSLIHFSIFSFSKNNQMNLSNINEEEKFLLFLEKLENSKGFQNFEKKSNRPHTNKLTLIPSKSVLKMINSNLLEAYEFFGDEDNTNNYSNNKFDNDASTPVNLSQRIIEKDKIIKEYNEKTRNNEEFDLRNLLNLTDDVFESLINSRIDSLKDLFLRYAKLGEKLNTAKISLSAYMKFLRDCGVLQVDKNPKISTNNQMQISLNIAKIATTPNKLSKTPTKGTSKALTHTLSKSPISSRTAVKGKEARDSSKNIGISNYNANNNLNSVTNKKNFSSGFFGPGERKLTDSEVSIIYSFLMGPRNLENSGKIKHYFDNNSGYSLAVGDGNKYAVIDKNQMRQINTAFNGKMDFNMFMKSLEIVANKLFPELRLNNAMQKLFNEYIYKVLNTNESLMASKYMQEIIEKVRNPAMKEFLLELYNYLIFHYQNYSDNNGYMSFEQLFDFYKDFAIFPDIITLIQIKTIFNSLSEYFNNEMNKEIPQKNKQFENKTKKRTAKTNFINYPLFLESLAITAMSFKFNERFTDIDKILYLMERINQSKGINCSQFRCGNTYNASKDLANFLAIMKEKYPDFYNTKVNRDETKGMPIRFDDIYNNKDF